MARPGGMRHPQWRRRRGVGAGVTCGQTFDGQVGASTDDAREAGNGSCSTSATNFTVDSVNEFHGHRWQTVTVPNGATIEAATMEVYIYGTSYDEPEHTFYAEDADDAAAFTTDANNISGRDRTAASMLWDDADIGVPGAQYETTPDITDLIQEVVDREGWASGQSIVIVDHGSADAARDLRLRFWDFVTQGDFSAKLHIQYCA